MSGGGSVVGHHRLLFLLYIFDLWVDLLFRVRINKTSIEMVSGLPILLSLGDFLYQSHSRSSSSLFLLSWWDWNQPSTWSSIKARWWVEKTLLFCRHHLHPSLWESVFLIRKPVMASRIASLIGSWCSLMDCFSHLWSRLRRVGVLRSNKWSIFRYGLCVLCFGIPVK